MTEFANAFRTGYKGRVKTEGHFTPDSYLLAILNGKSKRLEYSNKHFMGNLEMDVPGVHNKEFYDMFNTLQANPTPENLKTVNDYITKLGGDPIELINGELVIPIPVTYK